MNEEDPLAGIDTAGLTIVDGPSEAPKLTGDPALLDRTRRNLKRRIAALEKKDRATGAVNPETALLALAQQATKAAASLGEIIKNNVSSNREYDLSTESSVGTIESFASNESLKKHHKSDVRNALDTAWAVATSTCPDDESKQPINALFRRLIQLLAQ